LDKGRGRLCYSPLGGSIVSEGCAKGNTGLRLTSELVIKGINKYWWDNGQKKEGPIRVVRGGGLMW